MVLKRRFDVMTNPEFIGRRASSYIASIRSAFEHSHVNVGQKSFASLTQPSRRVGDAVSHPACGSETVNRTPPRGLGQGKRTTLADIPRGSVKGHSHEAPN